MNTKIINIVEELKSLTLLEAAELVKQIEKTFDVDASAASAANVVSMPSEGINNSSVDQEVKTDFDLILDEVPSDKKIAILKVVRGLTGLGLKEAKELVDSVPKLIKDNLSKNDAEEMRSKLENAGAKVSIK